MRSQFRRCLILAAWWGGAFSLTGCARSEAVAPIAAPAPAAEASQGPAARGQAPEADQAEAPKQASGEAGFRFPGDLGSALVAKLLPADEPPPPAVRVPDPRRIAPPSGLESPTLPLPPSVGFVPRLPAGLSRPPLRPRLISGAESLTSPVSDPVPPLVLSLPARERTRLPSVDVNQPLSLPILALPVPDRASLDDATGEASHTAALAASPPRRGTPAPFLRLGLPDPFENRRPLTATAEEVLPAPAPLRLPKP